MSEPVKKLIGFAALPPERRRELASRGGTKAQTTGRCHRFNSANAQIAGRKGGQACANKPGQMRKIAALGVASRLEKLKARREGR